MASFDIAVGSYTVLSGDGISLYRITPDGQHLLCACRDSHEIEVHTIAPDSTLHPLFTFPSKSPVCLKIQPHKLKVKHHKK